MHYSNGRLAQIGDLVKGKGYNLKHEIIGVLLQANAERDTCNCTVACMTQAPVAYGRIFEQGGKWVFDPSMNPRVDPYYEYGQLDHFVALDPRTGEVLPPH